MSRILITIECVNHSSGVRGTVLLVSGLPLGNARPTSFERQLGLLAGGLRGRGFHASVLGPDPEPLLKAMDGLTPADGVILLGYPGQFAKSPAPRNPDVRKFLWTQCSRRPDARLFDPFSAVPLTPMTAAFLKDAGVARVCPAIPHGVDTVFFQPLDAPERARVRQSLGAQDRFVVGAVGANTARKRFDLIAESFALFSAQRANALLLIKTDRAIGLDGTDLPGLAKKYGIGDKLILLEGEHSETRMRELFGAMDVFVNLSEWEGFCVPVLEAMSMGIPVIAQRVQGPGEIVPYGDLMAEDGLETDVGGSLLVKADPRTAAGLMEKACRDAGLLWKLSMEGRIEAEARYDLQAIARKWESLLEAGA